MYLAFFIKGADTSVKDSLGTYKVSDKESISRSLLIAKYIIYVA
jgi:hypothetical protein